MGFDSEVLLATIRLASCITILLRCEYSAPAVTRIARAAMAPIFSTDRLVFEFMRSTLGLGSLRVDCGQSAEVA
jgi:hypothetical protein